jgi:hypothetical protein
MTTIDVLVKKAPSRNLVSQREPAAPPDPYAAGCPTRLLQLWARDHIADVLAARRRYDGSGRR